MGEHRRGDAADQNEAQDRDCKYSHFQVQIDGMRHSRSTSRRKTVREARVRTRAIVERDARMGGGWPLPGPALPRCAHGAEPKPPRLASTRPDGASNNKEAQLHADDLGLLDPNGAGEEGYLVQAGATS